MYNGVHRKFPVVRKPAVTSVPISSPVKKGFLASTNHDAYDKRFKIKNDKLEELIKEHGKLVVKKSAKKKTRHAEDHS